jgi:hypothetical protein
MADYSGVVKDLTVYFRNRFYAVTVLALRFYRHLSHPAGSGGRRTTAGHSPETIPAVLMEGLKAGSSGYGI